MLGLRIRTLPARRLALLDIYRAGRAIDFCDLEAAAIAVLTCGGGVVGCAATIASGGIAVWGCVFSSGLCYYAAQNIADKIIAYWDCRDRQNNTTAQN